MSSDDEGAWRGSREPGWQRDIGYQLQDVLGRHQYESRQAPIPDDPGWHPCSCGWEGYWSSFHPHVANQLRILVVASISGPCREGHH